MLNTKPIQKIALLSLTFRFSFSVGAQAQAPSVLQLNFGNTYKE